MANNFTCSAVPPSLLIPDTHRSQRSFRGDAVLTQLRSQIATEMDGEFVRCPVDDFIKTYLPFAPDEAERKYFVDNLLQNIPTVSDSPDGPQIRSGAKSKPSLCQRSDYERRCSPYVHIWGTSSNFY
ncbi:hypothetical protein CVT25_013426 [Psilocybe cyanescens]|uniref:Uncharacterized protein n=1 Tax=Psilocybe cyanescens TaxID=93625 RepID=A0A409WSP5_PSICY|nr:hypothetical protein CVT25_013426 [Psilocybe cyanescens]